MLSRIELGLRIPLRNAQFFFFLLLSVEKCQLEQELYQKLNDLLLMKIRSRRIFYCEYAYNLIGSEAVTTVWLIAHSSFPLLGPDFIVCNHIVRLIGRRHKVGG